MHQKPGTAPYKSDGPLKVQALELIKISLKNFEAEPGKESYIDCLVPHTLLPVFDEIVAVCRSLCRLACAGSASATRLAPSLSTC